MPRDSLNPSNAQLREDSRVVNRFSADTVEQWHDWLLRETDEAVGVVRRDL